MFNTVKRMFRDEDAAEILLGCIDGCSVSLPCLFCPICSIPSSIGGCIGGIFNTICGLCC